MLGSYNGMVIGIFVFISCVIIIEGASPCESDEFFCGRRGGCIPNEWRCDGDRDCPNGKDEKSCPNLTCEEDEFPCNDPGHPRCIHNSWTCDGDPDCDDNSDEDPAKCSRPRP